MLGRSLRTLKALEKQISTLLNEIQPAKFSTSLPGHDPRKPFGQQQQQFSAMPLRKIESTEEDFPEVEVQFRGLKEEFPCMTKNPSAGPEPEYHNINSGYNTFELDEPFPLKYGGILPQLTIAYETWGELNENRDNAVLIHAGLSASSHAKSHEANPTPGWWEKFVGPGCAIDTNKFFVICTNTLGGCYGSSGPSSVNPVTGQNKI